jgi:hypothetical protein
VAIDLEERRRRRDQRLAVQAANDIVQEAAGRGRTITLEWSAVAALLALGLALIFGTLYRHIPARSLAEAGWAGAIFGGLLAHAALQDGRSRLGYLALAVFAGLPLSAIPFRFLPLEREMLLSTTLAALGAAILGGALRWIWELRATAERLRDSLAAAKDAVGAGLATAAAWLRDASIKWLYGFLLLVIGGGLGFAGRQQQSEPLFWAGAALIFLIGSVGLWAPGVHNRPRTAVGLRHCGQLCFWLSLLVVPFVEGGPGGMLPYNVHPSLRFAVMGMGLLIVGGTWFLQKHSIFSHHSVSEPKQGFERAYALAVVVLGLLVTLAGVQARQRIQISVAGNAVSMSDILGRDQFKPISEVRSLLIVERFGSLPVYVDYVEVQDNTSYMVIPLLYPGQQMPGDAHGVVQAIRAAAGLNTQSFPFGNSSVEQWTR